MTVIKTGLKASMYYDFAVANDIFYYVNGQDHNQAYDGSTNRNMGILMNGAIPTFNANVDGSMTAGNYYFRYTYYNINNKVESDPSAVSAVMTAAAHPNDGIKINVPVNASVDAQVTHARIYRTTVGGSIIYYEGVAAYTGTAITYDTTQADTGLEDPLGEVSANGLVQVFKYGVPRTSPYIEFWGDRMWLFGNRPYSTGTVTTNGTTTIAGASTAFVDGMVDLFFVIPAHSNRVYTVDAVASGTSLTLTEAYAGANAGSLSYVIFGNGNVARYSYKDSSGNIYPEAYPSAQWIPIKKDDGFTPTGIKKCRNRLLFAKDNALYILSGTNANNFNLLPVVSPVGCIANRTMCNDEKGNVIFLSERGVYLTDGSTAHCLSDNIENIFSGKGDPPWTVDLGRLTDAHAAFDVTNKQYWLWLSEDGETYTNKCIVADFNLMSENGQPEWFPQDIPANASGIIEDSDGISWIYIGDEQGFVYKLNTGTNDGAGSSGAETRTGTATAGGASTLTDSGATFNTTGDGLTGVYITILSGTSSGDRRRIASNTANIITVASAWSSTPDTTSVYAIGSIDAYWKSKHFTFKSMFIKIVKYIKAIFKAQSTSYDLTINRYENGSSTVAEAQTMDQNETTGYLKNFFAPNKARYHQVEVKLQQADQPFTVKEIELEVETENV